MWRGSSYDTILGVNVGCFGGAVSYGAFWVMTVRLDPLVLKNDPSSGAVD